MKIESSLIGSALAGCMLFAASAGAETLEVTYHDTAVTVTWEQSSNPTPNGYGEYDTYVPVWDVTGDYSALGAGYPTTQVVYFSIGAGGGFNGIGGTQVYSGSEASPVFSIGTQTGFRATPGSDATLTFSAVPEASTWVMMLLGFAGLGFAGYRVSRRAANAV